MYVHNPKKNARQYKRNRKKLERSLNPCPDRDDAERMYLKRAMHDISTVNKFWLERTERREELWLPESHISSQVNDTSMHMLSFWQEAQRDDDGYVLDAHEHNLKATNMVTVGTWYRNEEQDLYPLFMPIVSPLPCDEWGAVPLNLAHWRIAIAALTEANARWRWVHAVREYWKGDHTWTYGGTFGWRMEHCKKLRKDKPTLCAGQAIYTHVLIKFLNRLRNTEQDI